MAHTFTDLTEFEALLGRHGIAYDESHLWG